MCIRDRFQTFSRGECDSLTPELDTHLFQHLKLELTQITRTEIVIALAVLLHKVIQQLYALSLIHIFLIHHAVEANYCFFPFFDNMYDVFCRHTFRLDTIELFQLLI